MSIEKILLPDIGDFKDSKIIEVLIKKGDQVEQEQSLIVLESDKASMEVPSPLSGKVLQVKVKEGSTINVGDLIVEIEPDTDTAEKAEEETSEKTADKTEEKIEQSVNKVTDKVVATASQAELPTSSTPQEAAPAAPQAQTTVNQQKLGATYHASPMIRQFANRLGADLTKVQGSGPKGRITKEDVESWIKNRLQASGNDGAVAGLPKPPVINFTQFGEIEQVELSRIKKISGQHLSACWLNAPHVTQFDEVTIDELEEYRQEHNSKLADKENNIKLTPLAFFIKAAAKALDDFPKFNSSLAEDGENLILKKYLNIGVAVDTPNGLVVPVIHNVRKKGVQQLANELKELSQKAREGKLTTQDMQGGCFTISSLGGIGGSHFTPIINLPEVAILGIGKATTQPYWNGKEFEPKLTLPIAVSYDHRVIDGADGARFIVKLGEYLSDLRNILL